MQAVLLATSESNKLLPLTSNIPTPMTPLVNRPVMEYAIEHLARQRISQILVCVYYLPSVIKEYFGTGSRWGVHLDYIQLSSPMGNAGALKEAQNWLEDTFLVIPGDVLTRFDLISMIERHKKDQAAATIVVGGCSPDTSRPVQMDRRFRVAGLTPGPGSPLYSSGVYLFDKSVLEHISPQGLQDIYHHLVPALLAESRPVSAFVQKGYWNPLNSFCQYQEAQQVVLSSLCGVPDYLGAEVPVNPSLLKAVEVQSGVWVGQNTAVHPSARLIPPLFIGPHCRIGRQVELGPDVILGRAVYVDDGATIRDSTIFDHSYIGRYLDVTHRLVSKNILIEPETGESVRIQDPLLLGEINTSMIKKGAQRLSDISLSLFFLIAALPILILLGLALKMSTGRLFTRSLRLAAKSKAHRSPASMQPTTFSMLRFNTRLPNGKQTGIGSWAERWELHRLPELLNVLRGDMELVGVPPLTDEPQHIVPADGIVLPEECIPGFTGQWYVEGLADSTLEHTHTADPFCPPDRSWKRDVLILWKTPQAWYRRGILEHRGQGRKEEPQDE